MPMPPEPLDLLPVERRRALRRDYVLRLVTVTAFIALALVGAAAVLLMPTYLFLTSTLRSQDARLASLSTALPTADEAELARRLETLSREGAAILALAKTPKMTQLMRDMLLAPRPGIVLSGFAYTPAAKDRPGALAISGVAATRNALRAYQLALEAVPGVAKADVPVSSYAKEQDIRFTVTVSLASIAP